MGDPRERNYQSLFSELAGYEKKGVYMLMNGVPASPMQIVQAHIVREDAVYMRDYVLNLPNPVFDKDCNVLIIIFVASKDSPTVLSC